MRPSAPPFCNFARIYRGDRLALLARVTLHFAVDLFLSRADRFALGNFLSRIKEARTSRSVRAFLLRIANLLPIQFEGARIDALRRLIAVLLVLRAPSIWRSINTSRTAVMAVCRCLPTSRDDLLLGVVLGLVSALMQDGLLRIESSSSSSVW